MLFFCNERDLNAIILTFPDNRVELSYLIYNIIVVYLYIFSVNNCIITLPLAKFK